MDERPQSKSEGASEGQVGLERSVRDEPEPDPEVARLQDEAQKWKYRCTACGWTGPVNAVSGQEHHRKLDDARGYVWCGPVVAMEVTGPDIPFTPADDKPDVAAPSGIEIVEK